MDAIVAQVQRLLHTFHQLFRAHTTHLAFVSAEMRRRMEAVLLQAERLLSTCQLLGTSSRWETIVKCIAVAIVGLALVIVLLEISVRNELAKEAADAAAGTMPAPSASLEQTKFEDVFPILPRSATQMETVDPLGALAVTPFSDDTQTFGQVSREPVPLPRPRKRR
jgi:hypothetical protein